MSSDGGSKSAGAPSAQRLSRIAFIVIAVMACAAVWPLRDAAFVSSRNSDWYFVSDGRIAWESTSDITLPRGGSFRPLGQLAYVGEITMGTQSHLAVRRVAIAFQVAAAIAMAYGVASIMRSRRVGMLTGFLFAIHPVVVPQVFFAEGRHLQVLGVVFGLSLVALARWRDTGSNVGKWLAYLGALLAPLVHPMGVAVAPTLFGLASINVSGAESNSRSVRSFARYGILIAGCVGVISVRMALGAGAITAHLPSDVTFAERMGALGRTFWHLIVPTGLAIHERVSDCGSTMDFVGLAALGGVLVVGWMLKDRSKTHGLFVGAAWIAAAFLVMLTPLVGFADIRPEEAAWFALGGFSLVLGAVLNSVNARVAPWLMGLLLLPLMWLSVDRARSFVPFQVAITESAHRLPGNALAQLDLAESLWSNSDRQEDAGRYLELALAHARTVETEFEVRYSLARLAYVREQKDMLTRHVTRLAELNESSMQRLSTVSIDSLAILCDSARMLYGQGDTDASRKLLESVLRFESRHYEARVELAMLDTRVGLAAVAKLAPGENGREAIHEQVNRAVVALKAVSQESRQFSLSAKNTAGQRLSALDINLRARTSLVDVLLRTPWRPDALVEALVEADQLTRDFPTTPSAWIARASVASQVDAKSEGEFLKRALECEPTNVNLIGDYAGWLLTMGRNKEALEQLDAALSVDPKNSMIKWRLADFHVGVAKKLLGASGTDRASKARMAIDRARAFAPDNVRVLAVLGEWHEQQSEWTSAADAFARAYAMDANDGDARSGHARSLQREALGLLATPSGPGVDKGVRDQAIVRAYDLLREAVRIAPNSDDLEFARRRLAVHDREERIEPLVDLARKARGRKDLSSAIEFLVHAEKFGPLTAEELALLGQCRAEVGDTNGAIETFERLKKNDPKSLQAANMLARLYTRIGNTAAARREAEVFIGLAKLVPDSDAFLASEMKVMELILKAPESR